MPMLQKHYNNDRIEYPDLWIQDNSDQLEIDYKNQLYTEEHGYGFGGYLSEYEEIIQRLVWEKLFPEEANKLPKLYPDDYDY